MTLMILFIPSLPLHLRLLCFSFSTFSCDQLKKKAHQLEEQLDYEMQAKDELEHKFKYEEK